jgi:excisionase family DNA binding protein
MEKTMERLLTAQELAEIFSIDESTVYKWAGQKRLPYIDFGKNGGKRCLRFRKKDIEKLIEEKLV